MVSVVIVNWNTKDKLRACLNSIQVQLVKPAQIIVIDNNSSDGSAEMVTSDFPKVILCPELKNHGYAKGNNIGLKLATSEYILTLNPDTELPPDNLEQAVKVLAQHRECGALSCKFIGPEGETQKSVRGFPSILGILGQLTKLDRLLPETDFASYTLPNFDYNVSQIGPQPMGTYLLFRRSILSKFTDPTQPYDEQFPIFFNEVDLLYRMKKAGYACWYESSLLIFHHHGSSTKQARKSMIWESHMSLVRYFKKHAVGLERIAIPFIAIASIAGAAIRARGFSAGFRH
ncbi:MAG: glycosyltransferase family 2 protein [Fimbriimonadaceae bacterium]